MASVSNATAQAGAHIDPDLTELLKKSGDSIEAVVTFKGGGAASATQ
jgi:serine protease AprX